jgi:hypothetical protein
MSAAMSSVVRPWRRWCGCVGGHAVMPAVTVHTVYTVYMVDAVNLLGVLLLVFSIPISVYSGVFKH